MPREFVDLDIEEVSAVDHPANKRTWLIIKRATVEKDGALTTDELLMHQELMEHWWELWSAFQQSVDSIMCDDEADRPALLRQTVEQFASRAQDLLPQMMDDDGMMKAVTAGLDALKAVTVQKRFAMPVWQQTWTTLGALVKQLPQPKEAPMPTLEELLKQAPKEVQDALAAKDAEIATLKADLAKAQEPPPADEDIWKGVSPVIKQRMEDLEKQTKAAEAAAAFEKAERIKKECMAEAATFKHLKISPDDHWPLFKAAHELPGEMGAMFVEVLRAADEAVRLSKIMAPKGSGTASMHSQTTMTKIDALAKAVQKDNANLSYNAALQQVFRDNPELYEQYRMENQTVNNGHGREEE